MFLMTVFVCVRGARVPVASTKGTLAPPTNGQHNPNGKVYLAHWIPEWLDLNFMVPMIATVIVVAVGILVICVAISRRRMDDPRCGPKDVYCRSFFCSFNGKMCKTTGKFGKSAESTHTLARFIFSFQRIFEL